MIDIGDLGSDNVTITGLNNNGQIIGTCRMPLQWHGRYLMTRSRAFVYERGVIRDINKLIDDRADWELDEAAGINDRGDIVGFGWHNGVPAAFLLEPTLRQ